MEARQYAAVLTGAMKALTEDDRTITPERLKQEVYPESPLTVDEVAALYNTSLQLLQQAVRENFEPAKLEAALAQSPLNALQQETFGRFWKTQRAKLHEWARKRVAWNGVLKQFLWRIDLKKQSKSSAEINQPVVIVELSFDAPSSSASPSATTKPGSDREIVRFEMDKEQLKMMMASVAAIQKSLQGLAGTR